MSNPTLIDLPPPPSDPVTPSDMGPGTPNSGNTSLSALSTTAIKDGHQGNRHAHTRHAHRSSSASDTSTTTLDAERADRISRLAGLERVATARAGGNNAGSNTLNPQGPTSMTGFGHQAPPGYFDTVHSNLTKERSTVGSASATGSVGRTTWASGSDFDADKTTDEPDDGISSVGGLSDEGNSSIVGFGEGAGSTVSGPVSTAGSRATAARQASGMAATYSPSASRAPSNVFPPHLQPYAGGVDSGIPPSSPSPAGSNTPEPPLSVADGDDARMVDGMTFDSDVVDTAARPPRPVGPDTRTSSGTGSSGV